MSWAPVCRIRLGMDVGQLVAVVSPNPSMVLVAHGGLAGGLRATAVMP